MPLECLEVDPGPQARASVIVLHGLGASGDDFVPICDELDLAAVGPVRFVFPHAPLQPVTINGGMVMRSWYDIRHGDLAQREDEAGLRASLREVEALIARERERGIASRRIVLAGFSQGCAMTLLTGLRHAERLAGLAALSGYLPIASTTDAERSEANRDVPIFMAHGTHDGVVPLARAEASRRALTDLGYAVEWHAYPMQHAVCPQEIVDFEAWLNKVLAA
jgi:phospholipase/carboxylesterase